MNTENKLRLIFGLKLLALAAWVILTIITCSGVWNYCQESFVKWCAAALFITNGFVAWRFGKRIYGDFTEKMNEYIDSLRITPKNK